MSQTSNLQDFQIYGYATIPDHPMWDKMWQRAGFDPKQAKQQFRPIYQGLDKIKSPVIVLGEQALRYVTGEQDLFRWRGRQIQKNGLLIYPTLEPQQMLPRFAQEDDDDEGSGLNHAPARFQGTWVYDVQQAMKWGVVPRLLPSFGNYGVDPTMQQWQSWVQRLLAGPRLSFDIETAYKMSKMDDEEWEAQGLIDGQILRISFCAQPGLSVSVSWTSQYMEGIKTLMASPLPKIGWNCPAAEHKVLTWDMRWVRADSLKVGDELVGLDEHRPGAGLRRRYRKTVVTACAAAKAELMAVTFDDGTVVRVTPEHPWLVAAKSKTAIGHNTEWRATAKLTSGMRVAKVVSPWDAELYSYEAGWLAGFYDGEGSVGDKRISLHQNAGATYDYALALVRSFGYTPYSSAVTTTPDSKNGKLRSIGLQGAETLMRFLGTIRPKRLLTNLKPEHLGVFQATRDKWRQVVSVQPLGEAAIMHIETSTHTYLLEGFAAHNCSAFDVPKLENENIHVAGVIQDYQDAWHIVQSDLPKGLEYVSSYCTNFMPWKHLNNSNPGLYSCIDADVALQNAIAIDQMLAKQNQTHLFQRHVTQLMPILKAAGKRGNLIDLDYSHALEDEMLIHQKQLAKDVQAMIPEELLPRQRYKRKPEGVENPIPITLLGEIKVCSVCDQPVSSWAEHMKGRAKPTKKEPDVYNRCKAAGAEAVKRTGTVVEWDVLLPWNPNSADQLKAYIRHFNHPMGKNRQTDQDSASGKHLQKLVKKYGQKHPVYKLVAEYKKVSKTISTYVYHNYADSAGLIHSTYVNGPSTWRLAAKNVNLTNVGKREGNPWAVRARRQIVARPGHIFVGADSTSIEAYIVGHLIGDPNFIRMAGKSIHAWLVCQDLGWEFSDETMETVKTQHKDLYSKMKTAIYLLLYGGDPYLMHMENPDTFPTVGAAKETQDKIFNLIPKLAEWQERTRDRAKKEGVLTSLWGYKHHFYDVYTFKRYKNGVLEYDMDGRPKIKLGKDGKRCLAFEPQNCAAAFGRDTLLLIGDSKWGQHMAANCFCHDAYVLEVPEAQAAEAEQFLVDTLTRPVAELSGLRIGCESEMGYNWADADPKCKLWADGNPRGMRTIRKVETDNG